MTARTPSGILDGMKKPTAAYDLTATEEAALRSLARTHDRVAAATAARVDAVLRCRGIGLSWELIGRELNISRQAAWEQFSRFSRYDD